MKLRPIAPVRWLGSGATDARLVVIRPLAYRPKKGARLLYRNPVYLLCTDPELPLDRLVQSYLWRWEVELNFRDEKTVMGVGERMLAKLIQLGQTGKTAHILVESRGAKEDRELELEFRRICDNRARWGYKSADFSKIRFELIFVSSIRLGNC